MTASTKSDPKPSTPSTEPKPLPKTAAELEHERMLKITSDLPADSRVYVLIPWEPNEQRIVKSQLVEAFNKYFEVEPLAKTDFAVAKMPPNAVLFVAHRVTSRAKREDGTFGPVDKVYVGGPIHLGQYKSASSDGYTWTTNIGAIVDAVTAACKHQNGVVWLGGLSGDEKPEDKLIKLHCS